MALITIKKPAYHQYLSPVHCEGDLDTQIEEIVSALSMLNVIQLTNQFIITENERRRYIASKVRIFNEICIYNVVLK